MSLVAANVDEELLAYGFVAEFVAGHFDLYDDTFGLQDQIHSPMSPCGAWRVLLCPHILEVDEQETVQKILDIVLVGYSKGLSSIVASAELPSNVVKALQDCPDSMQGALRRRELQTGASRSPLRVPPDSLRVPSAT